MEGGYRGANGGRKVGQQILQLMMQEMRGLESTITVLGVGCCIGGPGFGNCVEFDSVVFSGETIIDGKNMGAGVGFSVGNCWC